MMELVHNLLDVINLLSLKLISISKINYLHRMTVYIYQLKGIRLQNIVVKMNNRALLIGITNPLIQIQVLIIHHIHVS